MTSDCAMRCLRQQPLKGQQGLSIQARHRPCQCPSLSGSQGRLSAQSTVLKLHGTEAQWAAKAVVPWLIALRHLGGEGLQSASARECLQSKAKAFGPKLQQSHSHQAEGHWSSDPSSGRLGRHNSGCSKSPLGFTTAGSSGPCGESQRYGGHGGVDVRSARRGPHPKCLTTMLAHHSHCLHL